MEINKELIKNVLAKETENLSDDFTFDIKDNYILFADEGECQFEVNIYEFAFKCKEWAFKKKYTIVEGYSSDKYYEQGLNYYNIFKACECILEKLNEKNPK